MTIDTGGAVKRRGLLTFGAAAGAAGLLATRSTSAAAAPVPEASGDLNLSLDAFDRIDQRVWISHRGVHLGTSIAGENSLESLRMAKRAGFDCVETDVHLSADGELVIMHDTTLNRTVLNADGTELAAPVSVASRTVAQLKNDYILKADDERNRTQILTLEEWLSECARVRVLPFIEIKLKDQPDEFYQRIIDLSDAIMGAGRYVITSNNNASSIIRDRMKLDYVPLMSIVHQWTYEQNAALGNVIMALGTGKFSPAEYTAVVRRSKAEGFRTESTANNFATYDLVTSHGIEVVNTDRVAPDLKPDAEILFRATTDGNFDAFRMTRPRVVGGQVELSTGETITLRPRTHAPYFGGIFLEIEMAGRCTIDLGDETFTIENDRMLAYGHQVMLYKRPATFKITANAATVIKQLSLKIAAY